MSCDIAGDVLNALSASTWKNVISIHSCDIIKNIQTLLIIGTTEA